MATLEGAGISMSGPEVPSLLRLASGAAGARARKAGIGSVSTDRVTGIATDVRASNNTTGYGLDRVCVLPDAVHRSARKVRFETFA